MTRFHRTAILCAAASTGLVSLHAQAPEPTGLPGDHFSLQGALELFQKSESPEAFEKALNAPGNKVNNLDLNEDGDVDYIRVIDRVQGGAHALVLQVAVSETEIQDVAVIELEKTGEGTAVVQILGDEDIFGDQTIVEPGEGEDEDAADGAAAKHAMPLASFRVVVNVWPWPCVRYMYAPVYVPWASPWRWASYPAWWRPWRPLAWGVFHPFRIRPGFAVVGTHRVLGAHRVYAPGRVFSVSVRARHATAMGRYRATRATVVVKGPHGGKVKVTKVHRGRGRH